MGPSQIYLCNKNSKLTADIEEWNITENKRLQAKTIELIADIEPSIFLVCLFLMFLNFFSLFSSFCFKTMLLHINIKILSMAWALPDLRTVVL